MSKLIILDGPSPSGKSTFAWKWIDVVPNERRRAGRIKDAEQYLREGFDVVLDSEWREEREAAIKRWPDAEVRHFEARAL